jgi:hypothetical protein
VNRRDQTQILEAFMDLTFFSEKALWKTFIRFWTIVILLLNVRKYRKNWDQLIVIFSEQFPPRLLVYKTINDNLKK